MHEPAKLIPYDPNTDWREPDPRLINRGVTPAPLLPLQLLGDLSRVVEAMAQSRCTPPDYPFISLVTATAGAIGAARQVQLRDNWIAPPIIWAALVGNPSSGKTPAMDYMRAPLKALERTEDRASDTARREHETRRQEARELREQWERETKDAVKQKRAPVTLSERAEDPGEYIPPRLIVGDATPEKLGRILAASPRGLVMLRDELAGLIGNLGKYGGDGDAAFYLSAFDGVFEPIDRVKAGTFKADRAFLSIIGGIQPDRVRELLLSRANDGLVSRFLCVWPDPAKAEWTAPAFDPSQLERLFTRLRSLQMESGADGHLRPRTLKLSVRAHAAYGAWYEKTHAAIRGESGLIAEFAGKLLGVAGRLALVLECLDWAISGDGPADGPGNVSLRAVEAATLLCDDYFIPMARRVYGEAGISQAERHAAALMAEIGKRNAAAFNAVTVRREWGIPGLTGASASPMNAALAILIEADCVREIPRAEGRGRPAAAYSVNPRALHKLQMLQKGAPLNASGRISANVQFMQRGETDETDLEERAAIHEFDGGMSRAEAETAAREALGYDG